MILFIASAPAPDGSFFDTRRCERSKGSSRVNVYKSLYLYVFKIVYFINQGLSLLWYREQKSLAPQNDSGASSSDSFQRFSRAGPRGRAREWATLGVHPLSWLLSNNRLEEVCGTLTKGIFSSRLLLSNQDKGCTPSVAHSLPLPLPLPLPPSFCPTCQLSGMREYVTIGAFVKVTDGLLICQYLACHSETRSLMPGVVYGIKD